MQIAHVDPRTSNNNLGTSIQEIPVEVLSRIFCYLSSSAKADGEDLHALAPPWRSVLHVCRWWRQIALETKGLWQIIPLGHVEWAKMALRLSYPRSISLSAPAASPTSSPNLYLAVAEVAIPDLHRAHRIHLALSMLDDDQSHDRRIFDSLREVVPNDLVDFRLEGVDAISIHLHNAVLKHEPARLKCLHLENCVLNKPPNVFCVTLTTLRLEGCTLTPTYTMGMLMDDIKLLQNLEELNIFYTTPLSDVSSLSRGSRTLLPHLKSFTLGGQYPVVYACLANIDAPLDCDMTIYASAYGTYTAHPSSEGVRPLTQLLAARIFALMATLEMDLEIQLDDADHGGTGCLSLTGRNTKYRSKRTKYALDWGADPDLGGQFEAPTLINLIAMVPSDIKITALHIDAKLDPSDWETIRPLFSRIRALRFQSASCVIDCPILHHRLAPEEMPCLRKIHFDYYETLATSMDNSSFHLIRTIIHNCLPRTGLEVMIRLGHAWPTGEDLATLESYGQVVGPRRLLCGRMLFRKRYVCQTIARTHAQGLLPCT